MNMSFYSSAVGAAEQQKRMNVQANNIANINTYGFKAEKPTFSTLMYGDLEGIGGENLPRGTGARLIQADHDFASSALYETGMDFDYAIEGRGFFALYDPRNGETSYTRDGSFIMAGFDRPNAQGAMEHVYMLSDGDGRLVMGKDGKPIEITDKEATLPIAVYDFVNLNGFHAVGANRFLPVGKNGAPQLVEDAPVIRGFLESSNVDLANEFVKVIEAQRSFSYVLRMVRVSDEVETTINELRR